MSRRKKRSSADKYVIFAAIGLAVVLFIYVLVSGASASDDSYTVLTPTVYQGETLSVDDFIKITSPFSGCTVSSDGEFPTDAAGSFRAEITIEGNGGYKRSLDCAYKVLPLFRDGAVIEAGDGTFDIKQLLAPDVPDDVADELSPRIISGPPAGFLGDAEVTVSVRGGSFRLNVTVADTTPPKADPKTVIITSSEGIDPAGFVENITDATDVTCAFADEYSFETIGVIGVNIVLTDAAGNTSTVSSTADCRVDKIPPTLTWEDDLVAELNGTVSYRAGVTASDNAGDATFTVDNSAVDLGTVGEYTVVYTVTDQAGNTAVYERKLTVVKKLPPSEAVVRAIAEDIYNTYIHTDPSMSKWDIAYAIFRWTHDTIQYVGEGIDKSNWLTAAYDGFAAHSGDCFTSMAIARILLEAADIDCLVVEHMPKNENDHFRHWWLLVNVGDGWYHFDATRRKLCKQFEAFMRTDAELLWYRKNYDDGYYRFDADSGIYPERSTESYYGTEDDILTPPGELHPD